VVIETDRVAAPAAAGPKRRTLRGTARPAHHRLAAGLVPRGADAAPSGGAGRHPQCHL